MGGGTIETTNGYVTGMLTDGTGVPSPHVIVRLQPSGFDPVKDNADIPYDTTDTQGMYHFSAVVPGDYTIQGASERKGMRVLVRGIQVKQDSTVVPTDTFRLPGTLKVTLPDSISHSTGYVYIPGSSVFVLIGSNTDHQGFKLYIMVRQGFRERSCGAHDCRELVARTAAGWRNTRTHD
jgi:hypothetical protein